MRCPLGHALLGSRPWTARALLRMVRWTLVLGMPSDASQPEYLTLPEAARMLGMLPATLERWARARRIPSGVDADGRRTFRRADVVKSSVRMDHLPGAQGLRGGSARPSYQPDTRRDLYSSVRFDRFNYG